MGIYIIGIAMALIGSLVSNRLKSKFKKYSKLELKSRLSGREVAEQMLKDFGIHDVKVMSVGGSLTDHYNPANKTVNLSAVVYDQRNAAAAAVAAHECGHAVQHAKGYAWLQMRSKLVPIVSITSRFLQWILLAGILMIQVFPQLLLVGIALFALTTLFAFITLPVEFDASRRALAWVKEKHIVTPEEYAASKDSLKWAALTYVVSAIGSLATLLYYLSIYLNRRR
ncbi:MAG: hypothetical protein GC193_01645 [Cryomorphaceae bacterium]|nr:hypothetical protein [Cryomorphaceae bacterium]